MFVCKYVFIRERERERERKREPERESMSKYVCYSVLKSERV